jgi:hypothetical protein
MWYYVIMLVKYLLNVLDNVVEYLIPMRPVSWSI